MIVRALASLVAMAGLALAPLTGDARVLVVPDCGGGRHIMIVPGDADAPAGEGGGCAKACHAVTDRREKSRGARKGCC